MDVKQAVNLAKQYFADIFAEEQYADLGLEEINFDDSTGSWEITIGFRRPLPSDGHIELSKMLGKYSLDRSYKIVRISDSTGKVISVKNREMQFS